MKKQTLDNYYISRKSPFLKDFDKTLKDVRRFLASSHGDDLAGTIVRESRQEQEALFQAQGTDELTSLIVEPILPSAERPVRAESGL